MHVKPTKEELEAGAQKALEEAEALKNIDNEEEHEEVQENQENDSKEDSVVEDETEDDDKVEDKPKEIVKDDKKEVVKSQEEIQKELDDKNKKLKYSAQEAIILHSTNEKIQNAITEASDMPAPTDEEMKSEYADWDDMDTVMQKMARENLWNSRKIQAVTSVSQEFKDYEGWKGKVNTFLDDPKTLIDTPLLEGKLEDFKQFAMKPTRRNVDFEDLVKSFLYDAETTKVSHKGAMLDGSTGKSKDTKPVGMLTVEQGSLLRQTDFKKWRDMAKAGKIQSAV